jgi:hypothetical protein
MDYVEPLEAIIPGTQGRVLGVLARTDAELTMRTVAHLGGVSPNRAASVLGRLVSLGLVERREAGSAALVRLQGENEAARAVHALVNLRQSVLDRLQAEARIIEPAPASLVVFGSFATGLARAESDLDVLAVLPLGLPADDPRWIDSLGRWSDLAAHISGNAVSLTQAAAEEMPTLLRRRGSVWEGASQQGVVLVGRALGELEMPR